MLKLKDTIDFKTLENYGFTLQEQKSSFLNSEPKFVYTYMFLCIDVQTREVYISSGLHTVEGDLEIEKTFELIQDGLLIKGA